MKKITVIGSGASAVHFSLSTLKKGHDVTMLDVGYVGAPPVSPECSFQQLKSSLPDPVAYFLGEDFESVVPPDYAREIYGFPPNKHYIFRHPKGFSVHADGFEPLFSFARGGLAQAWTGGSYPFNAADLEDFPIFFEQLEPYYSEVAKRIGIMGAADDLDPFFPCHEHLSPPLEFDDSSRRLMEKYLKKREILNKKTGVWFGRSRVAVLTADNQDRRRCDYSGRCLWGCPANSLYVPEITWNECMRYPNFHYIPNRLVTSFDYDNKNRISTILARDAETGEELKYPVETLVLAAGSLSTAQIFLTSIYRRSGRLLELQGLMDNRQILVPFIHLEMIGKPYNPDTYQYHQLAVGFFGEDGKDYIHGQVTTLKTALMQPVLQTMPLDWKTAIFLGRTLHSALGVVNLNFSDTRRRGNYVSIKPGESPDGLTDLHICYRPPEAEKYKFSYAIHKIKSFMSGLGAIIPPGQAHMRPMGASVHYSGILPMSAEAKENAVNPNCCSYDFPNLYIIDGSTLPFLPAKNLTFTLMANAVRVADKEF